MIAGGMSDEEAQMVSIYFAKQANCIDAFSISLIEDSLTDIEERTDWIKNSNWVQPKEMPIELAQVIHIAEHSLKDIASYVY